MALFGPPDVAKLKAQKDIPGLIKALSYRKDRNVRLSAAKALEEIGSPEAFKQEDNFKALLDVLRMKDSQPLEFANARMAAVRAVQMVGDPRAAEPMAKAMWHVDLADARVQRTVIAAFVAIGSPAVDPLLKILRDEKLSEQQGGAAVEQAVVKSLAGIGDPRAIEPLARLLLRPGKKKGVGQTTAAAYAATGLGKIGGPQAKGILLSALKNDSSDVREAAVRALVEISDDEVVDALIELLGHTEWDSDPEAGDLGGTTRSEAARALGKSGNKRAVAPLIQALQNDPKAYVRAAAAQALGLLGDQQALPALNEALASNQKELVKAAQAALEQLQQPSAA
ncbi:MAG: HEAT repeat domain-containing protein [Ardenticatenaceae bacterium]|nr:HEAT repeat domain-containing protein [Anaerolineales bacterium]MCB8918306.1 HEAT repeat domain-containing protein [Ardenticatenaceae bacterium]